MAEKPANPYESPSASRPNASYQTGESPSRPTRVRFIVMLFLGTLAFITYYDRFYLMRAEKYIKADLGLTDAQMGLVFGAFWLAYALFELPGGWMGDKYGARITLTRIVFAWSLFTALSGSAAGFVSLITCRFLFGVFEAGAFPNMARIQSRWLPVATRPRASGLLWLTARWGGAASPLLFGTLIRYLDSPGFRESFCGTVGLTSLGEVNEAGGFVVPAWRIGSWISGGIGLIWIALFYWWFRDHPSENKSVNDAELALITKNSPPEVRGHGMPGNLWLSLFSSPRLWVMGIYYFCISYAWSFFASLQSRYFQEVLKTESNASEIMAGGPLFFGGIACVLGGWLCQRMIRLTGRRQLMLALFPMIGTAVAGCAMFSLRYVTDARTATMIQCLVLFANDFGQAAVWSAAVNIGGKYAGASAGFLNLVGNFGNAFQPYIGARLVESMGWSNLFVVYAGMYFIASFLCLFMNSSRTFYHHLDPHDHSEEAHAQ